MRSGWEKAKIPFSHWQLLTWSKMPCRLLAVGQRVRQNSGHRLLRTSPEGGEGPTLPGPPLAMDHPCTFSIFGGGLEVNLRPTHLAKYETRVSLTSELYCWETYWYVVLNITYNYLGFDMINSWTVGHVTIFGPGDSVDQPIGWRCHAGGAAAPKDGWTLKGYQIDCMGWSSKSVDIKVKGSPYLSKRW